MSFRLATEPKVVRRRATAGVPSVEPSSTTMASFWHQIWPSAESTQFRRTRRRYKRNPDWNKRSHVLLRWSTTTICTPTAITRIRCNQSQRAFHSGATAQKRSNKCCSHPSVGRLHGSQPGPPARRSAMSFADFFALLFFLFSFFCFFSGSIAGTSCGARRRTGCRCYQRMRINKCSNIIDTIQCRRVS